MPKRKKYPKLPNGYGTIRYLGKGRRNCYAVHPPAKIEEGTGRILRQKPICYVDAWIKGFTVLTSYKAGTYTPGMEKTLEIGDTGDLEGLSRRILADYNRTNGISESNRGKTFAEVYEEFFKWKYENERSYSKSSIASTRAAFKNSSALHDREFSSLKYHDLQGVIDNCKLKHASLELIVSLFKQMYRYADIQEYIDKNYAEHVRVNREDDDEHGIPFTEDEIRILGLKTEAGKGRIVAIHSAIISLVENRINRDGSILSMADGTFRKYMYMFCESKGLQYHTPHDCRHTFSMLCEKYNVRENDRKRMLGHKFQDVTNSVYGHRTLDDLRKEIEKIKL